MTDPFPTHGVVRPAKNGRTQVIRVQSREGRGALWSDAAEERRVVAVRQPVGIFVMHLGLQEFAVEQRLEAIGRHAVRNLSRKFSATVLGIRLLGISIL